jgi:hypothetical protein
MILPKNFESLQKRIIDCDLYPYQDKDIKICIENIIKGSGDILTREAARQSGKTTTYLATIATCIILLPALANTKKYLKQYPHLKYFKKGFHVGIVGPKIEIARIALRRMKNLAKSESFQEVLKELRIKIISSNQDNFETSNGSKVKAMSGNPTSFNEGESFHLIAYDEAQKLCQYAIYKVFNPMLASTNGSALMYGSAYTSLGPFIKQIRYNTNKRNGLHLKVTYKVAQKYSKPYKTWCSKEKGRLGEESIEWQLNFDLIWVLSTGNAFPIEIWEDTRLLSNHQIGEQTGNHLFCGIDWGKKTDSTVCSIIEKMSDQYRIIDLLELQKDNYPEQHRQITEFINIYDPTAIWAESTGVGDANTDFLQAVFGRKVTPITAYNIHTLHSKLVEVVQKYQLTRPITRIKRFLKLTEQFLKVEKHYRGSLLQLNAPKGEHEDYVDSIALALGAAQNAYTYDFTYRSMKSVGRNLSVNKESRVIKIGKNRQIGNRNKHIIYDKF